MSRVRPLPRWLRVARAAGLSRVADSALRGHPTILMYHGVADDPLPHRKFFPNDAFVRHLDAIGDRFTVISMERIVRWIESDDPLPPHAIAITFDDAYANLLQRAVPELIRRGMPATIYATSVSFEDRCGLLWFDEVESRIFDAGPFPKRLTLAGHVFELPPEATGPRASGAITRAMKKIPQAERERVIAALAAAYPEKPGVRERYRLLDRDELRAIASSGIEIGGHTVTHAILRHEDLEARRRAIASNFEAIKDITGVAPVTFAYPDGRAEDVTRETVGIVRSSGFRAAVTAESGIVRQRNNRFAVPRFSANFFGAYGLGDELALLPLRTALNAVKPW
jgi:peptidoglycan/xylan/chitin deacetylase (PgdA/CDA1 family)